MVLGMPFLTLSNANIRFPKKKPTSRPYITKKALLTTRKIELINKKKFAKAALDENVETFVVHVSSLSLGSKITINPATKAQITSLLTEKVTVPAKYLDFADVFSKESAEVFPEQTEVNEQAIKIEKNKQPPYKLLYNLSPIELKTLKTYIKTNLASGFI